MKKIILVALIAMGGAQSAFVEAGIKQSFATLQTNFSTFFAKTWIGQTNFYRRFLETKENKIRRIFKKDITAKQIYGSPETYDISQEKYAEIENKTLDTYLEMNNFFRDDEKFALKQASLECFKTTRRFNLPNKIGSDICLNLMRKIIYAKLRSVEKD